MAYYGNANVLLLLCGRDKNFKFLNDFWYYDVENQSWEKKSNKNLILERGNHCSAIVKDIFVSFGGRNENGYINN